MKKTHNFMSLVLLSSQLFFPVTSLATETDPIHIDSNQYDTSSTVFSTEDSAKVNLSEKNDLVQNDTSPSSSNLATEDTVQKYTSSTKTLIVEDDSIDSWMPDKNLQEIVSEILGKNSFTQEDMLSITSASIDNKTISNAQGLSYAKNLTYLAVTNTDLSTTSNLSEVGTLKNLTTLIATGDNLSDISFIKSNDLNSLNYVDISQNELTNLNSIAGITLPNIEYLDVSYNTINDISILENVHVPKLDTLIATNNQISDISPISNSTIISLKILDVSHNFIKEIESFANSTFLNLEELIISDNQLSDISIMKNLKDRYPNLHVFNVNNNYISNIDFMEGYNLNSSTSAWNQTYDNTISLIKPIDANKTQFEIPVPIISLDYQYDSSSGYYIGVPDSSSQNLTLNNITGVSNVKLTDGTSTTVDGNTVTKVQSFIIDNSIATLPSQIKFDWSGAQGQFTGSATININWLDAQPPVIEAEDQILYVGDTFDALNYAKAYDKQLDNSLQTNLTGQIRVLENTVNTNKAGLYSVKYGVTNSYGLTTEKIITVQVKANKQSIRGSDYAMYVGDKNPTITNFNPSATDKDGNPIEVITDFSTINFSKVGTYDIVLTAADGQTKTVTLTIKEPKQSIAGSDYAMYVGDKEPTIIDFKASATDKEGNSIAVTADFSTIDFSKTGTYDVELTAIDGQTKTVTLTIKEKKSGNSTNANSGSSTGKENSSGSKILSNSLGTTSTKIGRSFPKTGEQAPVALYTIGAILLVSAGNLYLWTRNLKRN